MSDLMWWSLVVRAFVRWVIVGVWCGWLVMVGGGFSICDLCASCEVVWWRVCWRLLIGGGVDVVICLYVGMC